MPKKNLRLLIAYDGTGYKGWESQSKNDLTIQGRIETVLERMTGAPDIKLIASGRTDAGVHALAQCANVHLDTNLSAEEVGAYLNRYLPESIAVTKTEEVSQRFHARYNCKAKTYRYTCYIGTSKPVFHRKYVTCLTKKPSGKAMMKAISFLQGTHDFKSFTNNTRMTKSSVRTIFHAGCALTKYPIPMEKRLFSRCEEQTRQNIEDQTTADIKNCLMNSSYQIKNNQEQADADYLTMEFHGDGFLRAQIRIMVGTLLEVGYGHRAPEEIGDMIEARDRAASGPAAPPQGLCLMEVEY